MPHSQTKYLVTLIAGGRNEGVFQTCTGGRVTGESIPDRSPGARFPAASGGDLSITPLTIGRSKELGRDDDAFYDRINALVGVENAMVVNRKPIDKNGNPFGKGTTWTSTLTSGPGEDSDNNADNQKATIELEMQPSKRVG